MRRAFFGTAHQLLFYPALCSVVSRRLESFFARGTLRIMQSSRVARSSWLQFQPWNGKYACHRSMYRSNDNHMSSVLHSCIVKDSSVRMICNPQSEPKPYYAKQQPVTSGRLACTAVYVVVEQPAVLGKHAVQVQPETETFCRDIHVAPELMGYSSMKDLIETAWTIVWLLAFQESFESFTPTLYNSPKPKPEPHATI